MKFHLSVGRSLKPLFPLLNTWGGQGAMIVRCLMESSGFCALAPNGGIFQSVLGLGRPFTSASGNGVTTASSSRFCATFIFVCERTDSSIWIPGWSIPRQSGPAGLPAVLKKRGPQEPQHHCLGRSRGGLTTKIHLACDSHGIPLAIMLSPGEQADSRYFMPLLDQISLPGSRGRPRKRCRYVLADKGYDSQVIRQYCDRYGMQPVIPLRKMHRKPRPGLPRLFDRPQYKKRNVIERVFSWLKEKRRIFMRYDKLASSFKAMVTLACIEKCLRADFSEKP
ncbi:ISPs1, transposase OrfB [Pseudomonas savastanoi pv. fraxini]|nr:ISPs1, transposase OrfB [Pseudomonas savastanoi pv. fraxini]